MTFEPLYDSPYVAQYLKVSTATVRRKVSSGAWPARKVGRTYKFTAADVARIVELSSTQPQDAA